MTAFHRPGYGGFPSFQFSVPNQVQYRSFNEGYRRPEASFAPHYPNKPFYQPPFNPDASYSSSQYDKANRPSFGAQLIEAFNELDYKYRHQQYLRQLEKVQREYWNLENMSGPLPPYYNPPPPITYGRGTLFEYEKETEFVPYPVYMNPGMGGLNNLSSFGYGSGTTLPPKVRVIFIPMGQSFAQQPFTGPLAMPPFLYNRMSQPLCSYPPPPPLPQLGSLPLTPAVQQMVLQRYSNPVAVLPYSSNWQTPQLMMPGYSQGFQQQQQPMMSAYQPSLPASHANLSFSMPSFSSSSSVPQSYMGLPAPSSAPSQFYPSLPPAPQSYIPPPPPPSVPVPQTYAPPLAAPVPQAYISPNSAYSTLPSASQPYIPPSACAQGCSSSSYGYQSYPASAPAPVGSAVIPYPLPQAVPYNGYVQQQQQQQHQQQYQQYQQAQQQSSSSSSPMTSPHYGSNVSPSSSTGDSSNGNYPSTCRACPPAPPPLSILVSGHCWVQHCSACHNVPNANLYPNIRPNCGRSTPLLRYPTVPQYLPDQTQQYQAQHYAHTNAPVMIRPWLRKTPPLPPGSFILSDRCYNPDGSRCDFGRSHRRHRSHKRGHHGKHRSTTVASYSQASTSPSAPKTSQSISPRRASKSTKESNPDKTASKSKGVESQTSSTLSSSGLSTEYNKTTMYPSTAKRDSSSQVNGEARQVNLQYSYQPQELPTVYHRNRYLKSSSESSGLSSSGRTSSDYSFTFTKENNCSRSMSSDFNSIREEEEEEAAAAAAARYSKKPSRNLPSLTKSKDKVIIVREFIPDSPASMKSISSTVMFDVIGKDIDALSTTSTVEGNKLSGDDDVNDNLHFKML